MNIVAEKEGFPFRRFQGIGEETFAFKIQSDGWPSILDEDFRLTRKTLRLLSCGH
jgi:hypothetical protein